MVGETGIQMINSCEFEAESYRQRLIGTWRASLRDVFQGVLGLFAHFLAEPKTQNSADRDNPGQKYDEGGVILGRGFPDPEQQVTDD
jgi:hypothetical protein